MWYIVLYENTLCVEVMYHFNEQVDLKISSKLIQASKGYNHYKPFYWTYRLLCHDVFHTKALTLYLMIKVINTYEDSFNDHTRNYAVTITMVLHFNDGYFETKCKLFNGTYCICCNNLPFHTQEKVQASKNNLSVQYLYNLSNTWLLLQWSLMKACNKIMIVLIAYIW